MKDIKTIVVDDETLARSRIINLLKRIDYLDLVAECKNGREALRDIHLYKPELIFLDIQMPEFNGFEVIQNLDPDYKPFVIFVTAFEDYALKAFDVKAVDYLLKPFDDDRFFKAVEYAQNQIRLARGAKVNFTIQKLLNDYSEEKTPENQFFHYQDAGENHKIRLNRILYVKSDGNYIRIILPDKKLLIRETMQSVEENLAQKGFIRIHRSFLVNKEYIQQINYLGNNQFKVKLTDGQVLLTGRKYRPSLEALKKEIIPPF